MDAWLTPDVERLSAPDASRLITIPNELWSYVSGALFPLTEAENWEAFGTATPEACADLFRNMLASFDDYVPQGGKMQLIQFNEEVLFSLSESDGDPKTARVNRSDLPTEAQECIGMACVLRFDGADSGTLIGTPDNGNAVIRATSGQMIGSYLYQSVIVPMGTLYTDFEYQVPDFGDWFCELRLIGWWE